MTRNDKAMLAALLAAGMTQAGAALAQADYPNRPVRVLLGYAAGGPTDVVGRLYTNKISEYMGQQVFIDNRAGAAGIIATEAAARSKPDGYTLLLGVISTHGLHPALRSRLPYDAVKDFTPVQLAVNVPMILVVNPKLIQAKDLKSLIAELKAGEGSGKYQFGSSGNGGISHMCMELFKQRAGIKDLTHVPYNGTGPAFNDLFAGRLALICEGVGGAATHVKSGAVRGIGTATLKRAQALPELPTLSESGLPGFEAYTWNMFFAPAGTPRPIVERLNRELNRVAKDPTVRPKLDTLGVEVVEDSTPDSLKNFVATEVARWTAVAKASGVKGDE